MAKSMLLFDFEHINEDQLKDVIERVKRDKRRRRENADWLAYSSRNKEERDSLEATDFSSRNFTERIHDDSKIFNQSISDVSKRQKYLVMNDIVDYSQISSRKDSYILLLKNTQEIRHTLQKICSTRQSISGILDSLIAQNELKMFKENIFRGAPILFGESENKTRKMNYQHRILRLHYQFVMDLRKLNQNIAKDDTFLDNLCKCHSTAAKLLQVFVDGWFDLMKMNQIREKFCDLIKSVIILNRVCETICVNNGGLNGLDEFMIDVLNKKCSKILHMAEYSKEIQESNCIKAEEEMKVKRIECSRKKHQSTEYIDLKKADDPVSIPIKKFKKLAQKHFGLKTEIKSEKNIKISSKDNNSRRAIRPAKLSQRKKVIHSIKAIHQKTSVNANIDSEESRKPDSPSRKQDIPYLESDIKDSDIESFSKKLFTTLEKEICTNMRCIFNNMSFGQLQIYQTPGQNNERHVFYHDNNLDLLERLKKLHLSGLEEMPYGIECGSLHGKKEVLETNFDKQKENEDSLSLINKEEEYMVLQRHLSGTRSNQPLQLTGTSPNSKNSMVEPYKTNEEEKNSSNNRKIVGNEEKKLLAATNRNSVPGLEPLDAIGSISEKLITECLKSISSQLDYCILQNIFDQEFL